MATYLLKQYRRGLADFAGGKLVLQEPIEVVDDDAAIVVAQPWLKTLGPDEFVRLEDQAGSGVAYWGNTTGPS